ncbi:Transcriptional regulator, MarR family [Paraburkholderia sabiae]|nr:Transcriptional regulator, MarR family [Paraburkholderia sabiae]
MLIVSTTLFYGYAEFPGVVVRCAFWAFFACLHETTSYNRAMKTHFDERFGFLISDVGRLVGKRFDDLARLSIDLTRAQCRALAYLSFYGDINQARLADLLEVAPISAGRLLDRMEEGGWIERIGNPRDRREKQIRITEKAEKTLDEAKRVGDQVAAEGLSGLTDDEAKQLISLLQKVRGNLTRIVDR